MNIKKQTILQYVGTISFIALCVAVANAVFFGTANFAVSLGFSVWSIVVPVMFIGSLYFMIRDVKDILKNPVFWILIAFGVWILFSAFRGYQAGNSIGHIAEDLQRVIYFALFPVILTILNNESRIIKLMKIVVYSSFALSILTIVFYVSYLVFPDLFDKLLSLGYYGQLINFTRISATICRILFITTPMQLFGCAFAMYFFAKDWRHTIKYSIMIGLNLFCILMSFTRTLYLATFVAGMLALLFVFLTASRKSRFLVVSGVAIAALTCVVLVASLSMVAKTNYFRYAMQRVFVNTTQSETPGAEPSPDTTPQTPDEIIEFENEEEYLKATLVSDNIRKNIKKKLLSHIDESPLCGVGLGMRLPKRNTPPEFFYLDLWAKTGIIGLLFFLIPIIAVIIDILKRMIRRQSFLISAIWSVGLIGLMVYSVFQPYMNTAPCILMYCCVLCVNDWQKKRGQKE